MPAIPLRRRSGAPANRTGTWLVLHSGRRMYNWSKSGGILIDSSAERGMPVFTKVSSTKLTLATLALTIMSLPASLRGQAVAIAEVTGLVTDQSGSAVVGAIVRMIDTDKGVVRTLVTDNEGRYVLPNLPSGPYRLEVQAKGFKDYVQSGIQLQVGNKLQINVTLQVGAVTETVEVQAAASMVEVSQTGVSTVPGLHFFFGRFRPSRRPRPIHGQPLLRGAAGRKSLRAAAEQSRGYNDRLRRALHALWNF